jgi:uncharacterized protein (DUF302 family)
MMFLEDQSKYDFEKTVTELKNSLENHGWKVSEKRDMQEHYATYGFEIKENVTYEICRPKGAVDILNDDDFTKMVPFMPMRVAVYKKSDGKVYVSRLKLKMMAKMNKPIVKDVMSDGALDLEKAVAEVVMRK